MERDGKDYYTPLDADPAPTDLATAIHWLESFMRAAESPGDSQPRWSDFELVRDQLVAIRREFAESRTRLGCMDPGRDLLGEMDDEKRYDADEEAP